MGRGTLAIDAVGDAAEKLFDSEGAGAGVEAMKGVSPASPRDMGTRYCPTQMVKLPEFRPD
jgi:hypothetical protein